MTKLIDLATKEKLKEYGHKNKSKKWIIMALCPKDLGINDSLDIRTDGLCDSKCKECWNLEVKEN